MRTLLALAVLLTATAQGVISRKDTSTCVRLIENGLEPKEIFALLAAHRLYTEGRLPQNRATTYSLIPVAERRASSADFEDILASMRITPEHWNEIEDLDLDPKALSERPLIAALEHASHDGERVKDDQAVTLRKVASLAKKSQEKLTKLLAAAEEISFSQSRRLLTQQEAIDQLRALTHNPKVGLEILGVKTLQQWHTQLYLARPSLVKEIRRTLAKALRELVALNSEIPQDTEQMVASLATILQTSPENVKSLFGHGQVFESIGTFVEETQEAHPGAFTKVLDRRFFSAERHEAMLAAIREAQEIIVFKLAEHQDVADMEAVEQLSKALGGAPIIASPPFGQIGLIPQKLKELLDRPGFHLLVDQGIQLTPDFLLVDLGIEDKRDNPLAGLERFYSPTTRVILMHPRVRMQTRYTGNYDMQPAYSMTTGSLSVPAYRGRFNISMSTDARAAMEAKMNRSVTVISRRYRNDKLGGITGSANGIAPRRVRVTAARYGNPAGLFDMGNIYTAEGVVKVPFLPALVLGDIHLGATDPLFIKATREALLSLGLIEKNPRAAEPFQMPYQAGKVKLGAIVLHDLIDGGPNNRHNFDSLLTQAIADQKGALDLATHIQTAAAWVKELTQLLPETRVVVPVDNHGADWLIKRLQEAKLFEAGRKKDLPLILKIMVRAIEEKSDPYRAVFQEFGIDTDQVHFMSKEDTYRVGIDLQNPRAFHSIQGVEVGQHSHMGRNGAKSISLAALLTGYGDNVTGHTHSSAEFGTSVKVGTGTHVRQGYHRGPSNSDASIALVYGPEAVQLLRMERGTFIPNAPPQPAEEFFQSSEFPKLIVRDIPPDGGYTTDQFRSDPPAENHGAQK